MTLAAARKSIHRHRRRGVVRNRTEPAPPACPPAAMPQWSFRVFPMRALLAILFPCALACAAMLAARESGFTPAADGRPAGWTTWSARAENAPRTYVDTVHYRTGPGSLAISGDSRLGGHGGWERAVS